MLSKRSDENMASGNEQGQSSAAEPQTRLRDWSSLATDEQTALRVAFGDWLDQLPPTCSLDTKIARFRAWLRARGVRYDDGPAGG
jgi:hypothetical protein